MNEQRNNGRGIFYGVIGVATLVVAIIGATFAYFTATATNNVITGNMATVSLNLSVTKIKTLDEETGMIPMSNGMVEAAVNNEDNELCVDDNGNAVCQIYKITINNNSSAGQFVDGYVALTGGSREATDYTTSPTTMRWAQVFESASDEGGYSTAGIQKLGAATNEKVNIEEIGSASDPHALDDIRDQYALVEATSNLSGLTVNADKGVLGELSIANTYYPVISENYIRVSKHTWATEGAAESFDRNADITSALVFNHSIAAGASVDYYIVVWLSETGTNQTPGATISDGVTNPAALNFFRGNVTFVSAQGSEVSATFSGYTRVESDAVNTDSGEEA